MQDFRESNADYRDARMGDTSNVFHRGIVRPHPEQLLDIREEAVPDNRLRERQFFREDGGERCPCRLRSTTANA